MDRLAQLIEQFPLTEIDRVLRRTVALAIGVGLAVLAGAAALGHALVGVGACVGLGIGLVNIRLIARSVAKVNADRTDQPVRALASRTTYRLAFTVVVVIGLAIASRSMGLGAAGGIALFYLILIAAVGRSLVRPPTDRISP